ncbi:MAG: Y-family DNA polymerase [Chitinophagaceae bacterium]|nr:Y-family DNA polymerase [Chitinophagaceae bacterium]
MKAIVDCNSFYCACERLFRPELHQRPVVVLSNNDGCVIARTDEAKQLGIAMGEPFFQCRDIIEKNGVAVFSSNYPLYGDISLRVMDTLRRLAGEEHVEVYSVDEAFLELSHVPPAQLRGMAVNIRNTVQQWTGIPVSIGMAPTKTLAKVANRLAKKDKPRTGCVMILAAPHEIQSALEETPVEDIWGIGRRYAAKLNRMGIDNAWQLSKMPVEWARKHLGGVVGVRLMRELNGEPCLTLQEPLTVKKQIATTRMFGKPVFDFSEIREAVAAYTAKAAEKLRRQSSLAGMIQVFVVANGKKNEKYEYNPQHWYRYHLLPYPTADTGLLIHYAVRLAAELFHPDIRYLKAGVILGELIPDNAAQMNLFASGLPHNRRALMQAIDNINAAYAGEAVRYAASGIRRLWKMKQMHRSRCYTTRWEELFEVR